MSESKPEQTIWQFLENIIGQVKSGKVPNKHQALMALQIAMLGMDYTIRGFCTAYAADPCERYKPPGSCKGLAEAEMCSPCLSKARLAELDERVRP